MGVTTEQKRWHEVTSLKTGRGELTVVTAESPDDLKDVDTAPAVILGGGTNFVGFDEAGKVALKAASGTPEILPGGCVRAPAGNALAAVIANALKRGLGGIASLAGIPGSIGGAAAMNAGACGMEFSRVVREMTGWDCAQSKLWRWHQGDGGFGYRTSPVPPRVLLFSVTMQFQPVDIAAETALIAEERARRCRANPAGPSAGSVFRNPPDAPPAGALLEQAGCKGLRVGPLVVSEKHANWILNPAAAPAAAADAWELVGIMRERVQKSFGITLTPEWRPQSYC